MSSILQVEKGKPGIWKYHFYYKTVSKKFWLSLREGDTAELKVEKIIFKREDQNPTGSIKDRGMAYQISKAFGEGAKNLVISSSGNAAISAAAYCQLAKIKLHTFVSSKIKQDKLKKLKELKAEIFFTRRPVSEAIRFSSEKGFLNLRPSVWETGSEGYKSLAFEIHQNLGKVDNIFIPVSSGTALAGIGEGYKILGYFPQFHIVQTTAVCPIARLFDKDYKASKTSLADALVARVTPRKKQILNLIKESQGSAWVISDGEIKKAWSELTKLGISTSAEGAAALAAFWKARKIKDNLGAKTVCLLTGKKYLK